MHLTLGYGGLTAEQAGKWSARTAAGARGTVSQRTGVILPLRSWNAQ